MRARVFAFAMVLVPSLAWGAKPSAKQCISAADEGQKLRDEDKLVDAREKFLACAEKGCPTAVSKECSQWIDEIDRDLPSVSFRALDEFGKEVTAVRVLLDDKVISESIESRARPLDPGKYKLRFERADGSRIEDDVVVRRGEKNRILQLAFLPKKVDSAPPPPAVEHGEGFRVPWIAWVGLGVFALGGVGTVAFAVTAKDDENRLRTMCAPMCSPSERGGVETKIALANASVIVGALGLSTAIAATIVVNMGGKKSSSAILRVTPALGGAMLSGAF
jgi:hypothetical protein